MNQERSGRRSILRRHIPEYATEITLILVSLGLLVFAGLTGRMINGETGFFDQRVLLWFRNSEDLADPIGPELLEVVVRDITALGGVIVLALICLFVLGVLCLRKLYGLAGFVLVSVVAGSLMNTLLKEIIARPRPDIVPHATDAALSSFPSGHTMMSTIVYLTLGALLSLSTNNTRIKLYILAWSIVLPFMVGVSRLYLGVHWPTDIIAGWIAGATWSLLCLLIYDHLLAPATVTGGDKSR